MKHIGLVLLAVLSLSYTSDASSDIRWSSTGGGWRAMVADQGFANLFAQAGLIGPDATTPFSSIAGNSGGSWFATQFFYSQEFYEKTTGDPEVLRDFVQSWMDSYLKLTEALPTDSDLCKPIPEIPLFGPTKDMCNVFAAYDGDWSAFIMAMLQQASTDYGDADFPSRIANRSNQVQDLQDVDMLIQTTVAPQSRVRSQGTDVMIGPNDLEEMYAVVLPAMYASSSSDFTIGGGNNLQAYTSSASDSFRFSDYDDYYLYPGTNGSLYASDTENHKRLRGTSSSGDISPTGSVRTPFGGATPSVSQLASISSAAMGLYSGSVPSSLAQTASVYREDIKDSELGFVKKRLALEGLDRLTNTLYQLPLFDDLAICSQYPSPCGTTDFRFLDGGFTDNPSFAQNIANYQASENYNPDEPLKMVLTNTNHASMESEYEQSMILSYFNTTFNKDIEPGKFVWAPGQSTPWASSQIFQESLNWNGLNALLQPVENSDFTTAILSGTTLDNPIFGTRSGLHVDILLININNDIPNTVVGVDNINKYTPGLVNLAYEIATNQELLERVQLFFESS